MVNNFILKKIDQSNQEECQILQKLRITFEEDQGINENLIKKDDEKTDVYILYYDNTPVATGRAYLKENGYKIERIAVPKEYRQRGFGKEIVMRIVDEYKEKLEDGHIIYLHSQSNVCDLYKKCGFYMEGQEFYEENIKHYKMIYKKM